MGAADDRVGELLDRWLASVERHARYLELDDAAYARVQDWPRHQRPTRWVVDLARARLLELKRQLTERQTRRDESFAESLELMAFLTNLLGSEHLERFIPLAVERAKESPPPVAPATKVAPAEPEATMLAPALVRTQAPPPASDATVLAPAMRRPGSRQSVLLFLDDLEAITYLEMGAVQNLRWLLLRGPTRRVWPIITLSTQSIKNMEHWLELFRTRILGNIQDASIIRKLNAEQANLDPLSTGSEFTLREGDRWLRFWIPALDE